LHPIPSNLIPSSQVSSATLNPSPQIPVQTVLVVFEPPVQLHPAITAVQVGLHPRPSKIFAAPLSHTSVPTFSPSPQIGVQTFGTPFVQE